MVDLSGRYANCKYMGKQGQVTVERLTPDGVGVGGLVDYTRGSESYSDAVQRYIKDALQDWISTEPFRSQVHIGIPTASKILNRLETSLKLGT